ncbi:acryloyl-CoA reductase [Paenibacillaceae bacterium]|nr:acryloyl-CoA reductase [Paenibacillaceae bacterium]
MTNFRAYVLEQTEQGTTSFAMKQLSIDDLHEGEVTIRVAYSSVNYKDGMAAVRNQIIKTYPLIPGIDLAGTVEHSTDLRFQAGDEVIVTGYGLGVSWHGGFSEMARVPADWAVPLPQGLTLREAMILGTAGFTAGLSVQRLEEHGLRPEHGPVLVTGATGGVGSVAVDILAGKGYEVVASTGKAEERHYLQELGAKTVIDRHELSGAEPRALNTSRWAGAVDPVGGTTLQYILSTLQYGASVATSGMTGGGEVMTTVYPFILRGVNWLGIDSVQCPMEQRTRVWHRLANDLKPRHLNGRLVREITLEQLPAALHQIVEGNMRGRTIVRCK